MEDQISIISILVENPESAESLNELLHSCNKYIIGRMGIPYREKNIHIISIALDAPTEVIRALSDRLSALEGVSAQAVCSGV